MDSSVIGLGAVAWADAWNAATPDAVLRLSIDPARLLDLLKGLPVSKALLADLQKAVPTGRNVEVAVTADREVAEVRTGAAHHLLSAAARDVVLKALAADLPGPAATASRAAAAGVPPAPMGGAAATGQQGLDHLERPGGVLWQAPAAAHAGAPSPGAAALLSLALPWLGGAAQLQVECDGAGPDSGDDRPGSQRAARVFLATLKLELPALGPFEARIRACGNAVAVEIVSPGAGAAGLGARLDELAQGLRRQGLDCAHVGLARAGAAAPAQGA